MNGVQIPGTKPSSKGMDPTSHIALGAVLLVAAGVLTVIGGAAAFVGLICGVAGSAMFLIGIIAQGVRVALRD